jgi:hypothetical protein
MTALPGLHNYLDVAHLPGLAASIDKHLHIRGDQGYTDRRPILLLNLAVRDWVEDLQK